MQMYPILLNHNCFSINIILFPSNIKLIKGLVPGGGYWPCLIARREGALDKDTREAIRDNGFNLNATDTVVVLYIFSDEEKWNVNQIPISKTKPWAPNTPEHEGLLKQLSSSVTRRKSRNCFQQKPKWVVDGFPRAIEEATILFQRGQENDVAREIEKNTAMEVLENVEVLDVVEEKIEYRECKAVLVAKVDETLRPGDKVQYSEQRKFPKATILAIKNGVWYLSLIIVSLHIRSSIA